MTRVNFHWNLSQNVHSSVTLPLIGKLILCKSVRLDLAFREINKKGDSLRMETSLALRGQRHKHGLAIIYFHDLGDDELNGLLDGDHLRPISKPF